MPHLYLAVGLALPILQFAKKHGLVAEPCALGHFRLVPASEEEAQ